MQVEEEEMRAPSDHENPVAPGVFEQMWKCRLHFHIAQ